MKMELRWYVRDKNNPKKTVYYIVIPRKIATQLYNKTPVLDLEKGIIIFQ